MTLSEALKLSPKRKAYREYAGNGSRKCRLTAVGSDPTGAIVEYPNGDFPTHYLRPPYFNSDFYGHADWQPVFTEREIP